MKLLFNDCSIDGSFADERAFLDSMRQVMELRESIRRFGRELHCARNMGDMDVVSGRPIKQVIQKFKRNERTAFMQWLTKAGPFWSDVREHGRDDYLQCKEEIVTDCAIGEAAYHRFQNRDYRTVSPDLGPWRQSLLKVAWHGNEQVRETDVPNYWDSSPLVYALNACPRLLQSWKDARNAAQMRYPLLLFAEDSFGSLSRRPFNLSAAEAILSRLKILDELMVATDADGKRTPEGRQLYQKHFTGSEAWFSDSTESEKRKFRGSMTFSHPTQDGEFLFCPWHGKVGSYAHDPLRIHFWWPDRIDGKLFIAYIGPKITKR